VNENFQYFSVKEKYFSQEECEEIIRLGKNGPRYEYFSKYSEDGEAGNIDKHHENHSANEILFSEEVDWLYSKVWDAVKDVNESIFRFNICELSTALILRTYNPGSEVKWHFDNVKWGEKIGIVIQLNEPTDYTGGELVCAIGVGDGFYVAPKTKGTAFIFPTFICHSVLPVATGVRHTLVGWVTGDAFV